MIENFTDREIKQFESIFNAYEHYLHKKRLHDYQACEDLYKNVLLKGNFRIRGGFKAYSTS